MLNISSNLLSTPSILLIGNFDGVHLGHKHLLSYAKKLMVSTGLPVQVMIFDPFPSEFFKQKIFRLQTNEEKIAMLNNTVKIKNICLQSFDKDFSQINAVDFAKKLGFELNIKHVVTGFNFKFGYKRQGDTKTLASSGNIISHCVGPFVKDGHKISSSIIRSHILDGNITKANLLLGRKYSLTLGQKNSKANTYLVSSELKSGQYKLIVDNSSVLVKIHNKKLYLPVEPVSKVVQFESFVQEI